jgi:DNA-binding response OmpR family regulator
MLHLEMQIHKAAQTAPESGVPNPFLKNTRGTPSEHPYVPQQKIGERQPIQPYILVVEDDSTLAILEAEILRSHGYVVTTLPSGELAITALCRAVPDLVVLDIELPGNVNGWQVLQTLRTLARTPVLITSSSTVAVRQYIRSRGETRVTLDHLPKPFPIHTLLKRVKRMLPITDQ